MAVEWKNGTNIFDMTSTMSWLLNYKIELDFEHYTSWLLDALCMRKLESFEINELKLALNRNLDRNIRWIIYLFLREFSCFIFLYALQCDIFIIF